MIQVADGRRLGAELVAAVEVAGSPEDAAGKAAFFRTGPGGYGEGDEFVGVRVPELRRMARAVRKQVQAGDAEELLAHRYNEVRLLGGLLLVELYRRGDQAIAVETMLKNVDRLNNWNLVDAVAPYVLGPWLLEHPEQRPLLDELVVSESVWCRRTAIVATFALIRAGEFEDVVRLAGKTLGDRHDLIHKATGWMLREVGRRDRAVLNAFLDAHAGEMPRTELRYALEKHSPDERRAYLRSPRVQAG